MYEQFYGLKRSPFTLTPDPSFLFMTSAHRDASAGLAYSILSRKGFTVLTGEAGTGKTTLLRSVIGSIPQEKMCFSFVLNPSLAGDEFLELALADFGLPRSVTKAERIIRLQNYLLEVHREGKVAVLFIDEAHRLSVDTLEEIRLLTNFETDREKLLQIVLVGQDELDNLLDRRELRQLKQRVGLRLRVSPLAKQQVRTYISHRWSRVSDRRPPFSTEAVSLIGELSAGIPRIINSICDHALLLGYAGNARVITDKHIRKVADDLRLCKMAPEKAGIVPELKSNSPRGSMELRLPKPVSRGYEERPQLLSQTVGLPARRSWWGRFLMKAEEA
jgi:general secretion pathway protein A